jgi:hypothetical protein
MAKQNNDDLALNALYKERLKTIAEIKRIKEEEIKLIQKGQKLSEDASKQLKENLSNLKKYNEAIKENNSELKNNISYYETAESSISGMSSLMSGLKNNLSEISKAGLSFASSLQNVGSHNKEIYTQASAAAAGAIEAVASLSQLNAEDTAQIATKKAEYKSYFDDLSSQIQELENQQQDGRTKQGKAVKAQIEALKSIGAEINANYAEAAQFANISKDTKAIYEELMDDLEGLEKTFKKIAITTQIFFSSFKNALGVALFYVGGLVDDFNELAKGVGGTVGQMFQLKAQSFAVSKILGEEAGASVTSLAEKLGNANEVTLGTSIAVGTMANRLGVSGDEAAQLVNQFGNLSGLSNSTAMNTMEAASQLASANGVAPAAVMKDIAENTEFFALYAKDGGANIAQAAIEARRLGVDLGTAAKISDNLLDYQTSVQSEMEASVLLGRNLNLNKARELAYAGDSVGAMKEALKAAGGINEFNKMDVYQKKAVAEALGTSVSELQQMSANMERAATPAGKLEESFNATTAFVREMGAGIAGTAVKGIGGMLIGMKDFKTQVSDAKEGLDFIKDSAKGIGGLLTGNKGALSDVLDTKDQKSIKSLAKAPPEISLPPAAAPQVPSSSVSGPLTKAGKPDMRFASNKSVVPKMDTSNLDKTTKSVGGINATDLIKGAAALLIMAAALYVTAKALQEFNTVDPTSLLKAGAALVGLGAAMIGLNYALAPLAATGILELVAVSMLAFGGALALAGVGAKLFGESFSLVGMTLPTIVEQLSALSQVNFLPIFGMAAALTALGGSLALVATTGLAALPVLAGIGLAAGAVGMLMGGEENGGENELLLEEIRGLRSDIQTQPIQLNLDGRLVYKDMLRQGKNKSN